MHDIHKAARAYWLGTLSHRLFTFGFDELVNDLRPDELEVLASMMPAQSRVLIKRARELHHG